MNSVNPAKSTADLWEALFKEWYDGKKQTSDADAKKSKLTKIFKDAFKLHKKQETRTILTNTINKLYTEIQEIQLKSVNKIKKNVEKTRQKMNNSNTAINDKHNKIKVMAQKAKGYIVKANEESIENTKTRATNVYTSYDTKYEVFKDEVFKDGVFKDGVFNDEVFKKQMDTINSIENTLIGIANEIQRLTPQINNNRNPTLEEMNNMTKQLQEYTNTIKTQNETLDKEVKTINEYKEEFEKTAKFQEEQDKTIGIMKKLIGRLKALSKLVPQTRSLITYIETTMMDADGNPTLSQGTPPTEIRIQSHHKLNVWITPRASFDIENFMFSYSIMKTANIDGLNVYFVMETFTISKNSLYINDIYRSISPQIRFLVIYATLNSPKKYDKWYLMRQDTDISSNKFYSFYSMEVLPNQELNTNVHRKETPATKKERDDKNEEILFENIYGISEAKRDEICGYLKTIITQKPNTKMIDIGEPEINDLPSAVIQINFNEHTLKLVKFAEKYKGQFYSTTYVYDNYGNKEDIKDDTGKLQMDTGKISDYELLTLVDHEFKEKNGKGFDELVQKYELVQNYKQA